MCTFLFLGGVLWDMGQVTCGSCEIGLLSIWWSEYRRICACLSGQGPRTAAGIQRMGFLPVKLRDAHAPGMSGTFSPPQRVSNPDMHHGTCVTHVPWCMPGSLTSGSLWSRWWGNVPVIPDACATRNFTHLVRGPWSNLITVGIYPDMFSYLLLTKIVFIQWSECGEAFVFFFSLTHWGQNKMTAVSQTGFSSEFSWILGRELGPSGVSPNQRSRWKHAFSPLKHV